jgi:hypothetical protein
MPTKTRKALHVCEVLLALALLLAIVELLLIQRSAHTKLPEVHLVERSHETLVVQLPPGTTTNAQVTAQSAPARRPETVSIVRTIPPVLAFENIRRLLGLLGPAPSETVTAYRHTEKQTTVDFPGAEASAKKPQTAPPTNALGAQVVMLTPTSPKATSAERARSPEGDTFRISLP